MVRDKKASVPCRVWGFRLCVAPILPLKNTEQPQGAALDPQRFAVDARVVPPDYVRNHHTS
jgi:hypothetical protein